MLLQFDRVLCYPKEVYDEDDELAAAVRMMRVRFCDTAIQNHSSHLRQVTYFHSWKHDGNHMLAKRRRM